MKIDGLKIPYFPIPIQEFQPKLVIFVKSPIFSHSHPKMSPLNQEKLALLTTFGRRIRS